MVSVMNVSELKSTLVLGADEYSSLPIHVAGFCAFLIKEDQGRLVDLVDKIAGQHGGFTTYQSIACLGFALASAQVAEEFKEQFRKQAVHLSGRIFFSEGRVPKFEVDGVALLGVALGLSCLDNAKSDAAWLIDLLSKSQAAVASAEWDCDLIKAASAVLGTGDWNSLQNVCTRVGLQSATDNDFTPDDQQAAWRELTGKFNSNSPPQVAVYRSVFDCCVESLSKLPIHGAGRSELIALLESIPGSMSHWTYEKKQRVRNVDPQRWEIDHEYHVQNLLWTILRPVFSDLVDEQSLPKVGHNMPRYDLGVPSLKTIIEVKFMRRSGTAECRKITEEIAADLSLYLGDRTGYKSLVAFIWDDCRQTEEYATLKMLENLDGLERVIILPRPSKMDRALAHLDAPG